MGEHRLYLGLGSAIREARKAKGMSLVSLGEKVGLDNSSLSRIETDKQRVSNEQLDQIVAALGITLEELSPEVFGPKIPVSADGSVQIPAAHLHPTLLESHDVSPASLTSANQALRTELSLALSEGLRPNVGAPLVITKTKYIYTYASNRVVMMAARLPDSATELTVNQIVRRLMYRNLLAMHSNRDTVGPPAKHYIAAVITKMPISRMLNREASLFDIILHRVDDVSALAALATLFEGMATEAEENHEEFESLYSQYEQEET
jgi:transcriptional regulator with XRE-family HTH domain